MALLPRQPPLQYVMSECLTAALQPHSTAAGSLTHVQLGSTHPAPSHVIHCLYSIFQLPHKLGSTPN